MAFANLVARFAAELAGVGALGYWGLVAPPDGGARIVAGIGAPLLLIVTWALVVAPNATNGIPPRVRELIGTFLLLVAAGALAAAGQAGLAGILAAVVVINQVLLIVLAPQVAAVLQAATDPRS
jgi:hypothetical protein